MRSTTVLVANPGADVYGSDLQLLESISAMTERGWRVIVAIPERGQLVQLLTERGAEIREVDFPVLRRASASPAGIVRLGLRSTQAIVAIRRVITGIDPCVVYVNTVTLPWWLAAARAARVPSICHNHEAEVNDGRVIRTALISPLALASVVVLNGRPALEAMCDVMPRLRRKAKVIYNGVPGPGEVPSPPKAVGPLRLVIVGRLAPRKGPDVALEALAQLRSQGRDVHLDVCGTAFRGYEWFVEQLERRAAEPDLRGAVTFCGYVSPPWPALERAHIVIAPSLEEPFGNAVVEAQLAGRPVVASARQGHLETVADGRTGLLVPAADPSALAAAVARLADDPSLALRLAAAGRKEALSRFSVSRYRDEIAGVVTSLCDRRLPPLTC